MLVCKNCLMAIESHEGKQLYKQLDYDDGRIDENDECFCEWCEDHFCSSEIIELF